jgi:hypothetical protein
MVMESLAGFSAYDIFWCSPFFFAKTIQVKAVIYLRLSGDPALAGPMTLCPHFAVGLPFRVWEERLVDIYYSEFIPLKWWFVTIFNINLSSPFFIL